MPTKLTVINFDRICSLQIRSLLRKARAGGPFSNGVWVQYCTGAQEFLTLQRLVWRYHALK